jgi:hypothetical protein
VNTSDISVRDYLILRSLLTGVLEDHLGGALPVREPEELRAPPPGGLTDEHYRWLMVLDLCATPAALRLGIEKRSPRDAVLTTLLGFFLGRDREVDHDRFEWLLTYIFKRRLESGEAQGAESIGAQILEMFPDLSQTRLSSSAEEQIEKLQAVLEEVNSFSTLLQLTGSGLFSKGRELKESFGEERYRPAVLAAVVNYNLVLAGAFRGLFDRVAEQNRELAAQLASADYRGNVKPLHKLATSTEGLAANSEANSGMDPAFEIGGSSFDWLSSATPSAAPDAAPLIAVTDADANVFTPAFQPDRELRERRRLGTALENLTSHFSASGEKPLNAVSILDDSLVFEEWEARALATDYSAAEQSFRARFARTLKDSCILLYRVTEEASQLRRKSGSGNLGQPHEESLAWLRATGQDQVQTLRQFAEEIAQRGLPEKQQQILLTALRLSDLLQGRRLRTTADPFGDQGDGSLLTQPAEILSPRRSS